MKWIVYNLLFAAVYPFLLPSFLMRMWRRGGYAARMGDRFALYPRELLRQLPFSPVHAYRSGELVWIHAVSVGEVQVAGQLMREWRQIEPTVRFLFSTTSSTGWKMAEKEVILKPDGRGDVLIYNPLDFPNFVKSALRTFRPRAIVLTESEIWPNFIMIAKRYRIPMFLINARVSDRSAPRYRLARFFFGDVLSAFTKIFAQSELDKARLVAAGAPADKVEVTGSFKFDVAHRNEAKERELRDWVGEGRVLLGGSTWPGEDEVLLSIYRRLKGIRLVIAPRHFEKADEVEANIHKAGYTCRRRSRGDCDGEILLADTTGELMGLYGIADAVFVGKSLCAHGSQNMIEPCLCGKPTFVGPYTENFRPVMSDLLESQAVIQVRDAAELSQGIVKVFATGDDGLGERAKAAVENRRGVVARCVAAIRGTLALWLVAVMVASGCSRQQKLEKPPIVEAVSNSVVAIVAALAVTNDSQVIDVKDMTVQAFYDQIKHASPRATLWMPGATTWVVAGVKHGDFVELSDIMERMAIADGGLAVPELFAAYVGTIEEVLPALGELDWKNIVAPQNFVRKEVEELPWLKTTGIDEDIRKTTLAEIRSMQIVRRLVLEGDMLAAQAKDKAGEERAIDCWARAAKRNPNDPFLRERVAHLERNGRGFFELGKVLQAMKCFETALLIYPDNAAAVHNFGMCLKKIGKLDLAEKVLKRAEELKKQENSL